MVSEDHPFATDPALSLEAAYSNFVGRGREVAILAGAVNDALVGHGRLVMLAGEPGIGKTRLAEETAASAAQSGARVLWGRCWEGGGAPAYWPWIQLIRESLRAATWTDPVLAAIRPGLSLMAQMVPELRSTPVISEPSGDSPQATSVSQESIGPGSEQFRLFDAITSLFKEIAATTPLMLVLDDLHAADEDSLLLLRFLARDLKRSQILIVATYREAEVRQSSQNASLVSEIGREGIAIPLRGLSLGEVADFVKRNTTISADEELIAALHRASDGNPFFLDEIARLMIAEGNAKRGDRRLPEFNIPDSVRTAIRRLITPLPEQTKRVLTIASVVGNEFDLALLREVSGISSEQLVESLEDSARNAALIKSVGPFGRYRFAHGIIADALQAELSPTERMQLHRRIAAALERIHARDLGPHLAELANHCVQALPLGEPDKAVLYARRGAERARSHLAFAEAVRLYDRALQALAASHEPDDVQRCEIVLAMGDAQAQIQSLDEARRSFEQAAQLARKLGRPDLLAQSALHASSWFETFFTVDTALMFLVEEALDAVGGADSAIRASLMAKLAAERYWAGERERGYTLCEEAVAMARRIEDQRALVSALWTRNQIRWGPENVERRLASATEVASLAESIGDYGLALRAHEMRFTALLEMGDMRHLEIEASTYAVLAEKAGERFGIVERFEAVLALLRGEYELAEQKIKELFQHAQRRQDPNLLACAQALMGTMLVDQRRNDPAQTERVLKDVIAQSPALGPGYRIVLAFVYATTGRQPQAAAEMLSVAKDDFASIPRDWNWLDNMRVLSQLCVALRDQKHGEIVYRLMLPYADRNITAGWGDVAHGSSAMYLGTLARTLGRLDEARAHLEKALAFNRMMGARPSFARAQYEYARVLLKMGGEGNLQKADELLHECLATASALGMKALEARASGFMAGGAPVRASAGVQAGAEVKVGAGAIEQRAENANSSDSQSLQESEVEASTRFGKEGDIWTITYDGQTVRLRDFRGLGYIAFLLRHPLQEISASSLVIGTDSMPGAEDSESHKAADELGKMTRDQLAELNLRPGRSEDAGEMIDPQSKAEYARRLKELREELEEAKDARDEARIASAEDEIDALHRELSRAVGRSNRSRRAGSTTERARLSVTRAIKVAIEQVSGKHPSLARHLNTTIRTGTFCSYRPDPGRPLAWRF